MATFTLRFENKILDTYVLATDKEVRIGRSPNNEISINNKGISSLHASIKYENKGFVITDQGSRNGTYIDGKPVKHHRLCHGDVVHIGPYEFIFNDQKESLEKKAKSPGPVTLVLDELDQLAQESKTGKEENLTSSQTASEDKKPLLVVKFKNKVLYKYPLEEMKTAIGRGADNQIVLDNPAVSTNHAVVTREGDGFEIVDLNSKNGTFVNDKKISRHTLQKDDVIAIGRHVLVFGIESGPDCTSTQTPPPSTGTPLAAAPTKVLDTRAYKDMLHRSKGDMATGKAELAYLRGGSGKVPIKKNILSIGSAEECDIVVKGLLVGENAAFVMIKSDGYYLTYNRGFAKPTVNGEKVDGSRKLYDGDVIKIGSVTMQFGL